MHEIILINDIQCSIMEFGWIGGPTPSKLVELLSEPIMFMLHGIVSLLLASIVCKYAGLDAMGCFSF